MLTHSTLRKYCIALCVTALATLSCFQQSATACPTIDNLVDYNCDQQHKIAIAGDSIVKGVGDEVNENDGGYVLRLSNFFKSSTIGNLGVAGVTSGRLLRLFKRNLTKRRSGTTQERSVNSDLLIIDVGRNDYWENWSPSITVRNIRRLVKFLRKELGTSGISEPFIAVTTLIPTSRSFQRPFIDEVNKLLLEQKSKALPVYIRLDKLSSGILSEDGLHPSSNGYNIITKKVRRSINKRLQKLSLKSRIDTDSDGIYDYFEAGVRFQTDPTLLDTDLDELSDGEEIFDYLTDPSEADTDGDNSKDGEEVICGTDPLDPSSYPGAPTPTPTPTSTPTSLPDEP